MSLALATFAPGAVIDATTVRGLLGQIETYVNEGTVAGDRGTGWITSNHVYRPDFYGAPNSHTTLVSGESYFRERPLDPARRAWWSYYLGENSTGNYYPVPGLNVTFQVPENIDADGMHRVRVTASFYAYEFGGVDGGMDEDTYRGASFALIGDGSPLSGMAKPIYKGSSTSATQTYAFYPRKQISFVRDFALNRGVHTLGVGVQLVNNGGDQTKHVVVAQGNIIVRYWTR